MTRGGTATVYLQLRRCEKFVHTAVAVAVAADFAVAVDNLCTAGHRNFRFLLEPDAAVARVVDPRAFRSHKTRPEQ